jgi:peptidoglycan/xylan/chitin deacetylase (PgdA/CDA1 family)
LYHRVASAAFDPFSLCVTPQHFAEQLAVLHQSTNSVPLKALVEAAQANTLPSRTVAVTFDDGYVDILTNARPLLERYEIPATIFVTTGYLGQAFWWDELNRCVLEPATLPGFLRLTVDGRSHEWTLSNTTSKTRRCLLSSLHSLLRPLTTVARQSLLHQLQVWAGVDFGKMPTQRALLPDEVACLADGGSIEIGAHSVSHRPLVILPAAEQRREIAHSKTYLEGILRKPVTSFSYPYGLRSDYSPETTTIVEETGFKRACSNVAGVAWHGSDRFQLPRFWVQDWNGATFSRWLQRWLNG